MGGYYVVLFFATGFSSVIFFIELVVERKLHLKASIPIFLTLLFLWFLPTICYIGQESIERKIEVVKLNGAYIAEVDGRIVNLNRELCMNFSDKNEFYIKTDIDKYKIFGDFESEIVVVKEK